MRNIISLGAVAGALAAGQAGAAVKLSNEFDANWFNPEQDGRGAVVDYAPQADGSGIFSAAIFSYDDATGDPTWVILTGEVLEHQHEFEVDIFGFQGGTFSNPFTAPTGEVIGTATVTVNSCSNMDIAMDFSDGAGFPDATYEDLQPVGGATPSCVYDEEFNGCPGFAEASETFGRACVLSGTYNNMDMTLTNDTTWVLDGLVRWGDDNANSSTLRIEPGTVLVGGGGGTDYIYISPGSQIFANGIEDAPIVLTSENDGFIEGFEPAPGDLGGVVISGNAPVNACPEAPFNCFSEFDATQRFGGDDPQDDSGSISYFQVRYAGIVFAEDAEVNAWTFQGVGAGTDIHHLQAYRGQDDGFEWFGGTVNQKHLVVTEGGDDGFDHDLGFSGKVQYGLVYHGSGFGEDYGIEGAGNPDNFTAEPLATPIYANLTMVGNGNGDSAFLFKDGSGGQIWNSVATGFPTSCLEFADAPATYDVAGAPGNPANTAFMGVVLACGTQFMDDDGAPYAVAEFFSSNAFMNNVTTGNARLDSVIPMANSPVVGNGVNIADDFFDSTSYSGAFAPGVDGADWLKFAHQPLGGQ